MKRAIDERIVHNEKLGHKRIENGEDVSEDDYAVTCQELLQERSGLKMKTEAILKSGEAGGILRSLEDAEQRLADVRVSAATDKSSKKSTSPQKEPQPDDEQNEHVNLKLDDYQGPRSEPNTLPIEGLCSLSQRARTKSNRTPVSSKSTTTKRVMLLELEALKKKQEKIDEQLAAKKRRAEIRKEHEELEIANFQEEKARALRISEKEIEVARAGSSRASTSFRSVSPITVQSDPFEKVTSWLDQINYES